MCGGSPSGAGGPGARGDRLDDPAAAAAPCPRGDARGAIRAREELRCAVAEQARHPGAVIETVATDEPRIGLEPRRAPRPDAAGGASHGRRAPSLGHHRLRRGSTSPPSSRRPPARASGPSRGASSRARRGHPRALRPRGGRRSGPHHRARARRRRPARRARPRGARWPPPRPPAAPHPRTPAGRDAGGPARRRRRQAMRRPRSRPRPRRRPTRLPPVASSHQPEPIGRRAYDAPTTGGGTATTCCPSPTTAAWSRGWNSRRTEPRARWWLGPRRPNRTRRATPGSTSGRNRAASPPGECSTKRWSSRMATSRSGWSWLWGGLISMAARRVVPARLLPALLGDRARDATVSGLGAHSRQSFRSAVRRARSAVPMI